MRDVAAQVVLGVDARCEADIDRYSELADRVLIMPSGVVERHLATLRDACTQPWMLRLDSDEVASPALIAALPKLLADERIVQYRIARRWLTDGGRAWVDEAPWWPDYQVRLVRTGQATFSGALHSSADAASPRGTVLEPLYHADLVLKSLAERQRKVAFYAVSGGEPSFGGAAARAYEPGRFARRPYASVPAVDLPLINRLLEAGGVVPGPATPAMRPNPAPRANAAAGAAAAGDASIEIAERDPRFVQGDGRTLTVCVMNRTGARWAGGQDPDHAIRLAYHWRWADGAAQEGIRTPFPVDVAPGETCTVAIGVVTPERVGPAWLDVGVVHEHVRWFDGQARFAAVVEAPAPLPTSRVQLARKRTWWRRRGAGASPIPRTFHRVWLGTAPMPGAHVAYGESWQRLHPDWTMRLWTDADAPAPPGVARARNLAERADLVRYEILRRHGGIYIDTDMECLRPIDELLRGVRAFAAYEVPGRLCNAVIGATPGHPAFERAVTLAQTTVGRGVYPNATATSFLTYVMEAEPDATLFAPERFYPVLWDDRANPAPAGDPPHAMHHWAKSWLAAESASVASAAD